YSDGKEAILPLLKLEENQIEISGLALFKKDKMIADIPYDQMFTFKIMYEEHTTHDSLIVPLQEENQKTEYAAIQKIKSKRKFITKRLGDFPEIVIDVFL